MSVPYFVVGDHECERCGRDILIGYEAEIHEDGMFCDEDCFKDHLYESSSVKKIYLTDDPMYREVD